MKENILGFSVETADGPTCVEEIFQFVAQGGDSRWLACLNPHSYAVSLEDSVFRDALQGADWLVPDGIGVVYASKFARGKIRERVTGSDIFYGLQRRMNKSGGMSVFFLGSTEAALQSICRRTAKDYPGIRIAGSYSPPFRSSFAGADMERIVHVVNAARPDVLWVGIAAPKQEKLIASCLPRLNIRFAGAVGAVFDFYAGTVKRSSPAFQRLGLEWLPRLLQQPRRLWRRTVISAPVFLYHVVKERFNPEEFR